MAGSRIDGVACTGENARCRPARKAARRRWLVTASSALLGMAWPALRAQTDRPPAQVLTVYTFGDSILDCARYNSHGVHPGQLLVRNDDRLFPEFRGQDLSSRGPARLEHRAQDGATVDNLPPQARRLAPSDQAVALLTIGGNDLLQG